MNKILMSFSNDDMDDIVVITDENENIFVLNKDKCTVVNYNPMATLLEVFELINFEDDVWINPDEMDGMAFYIGEYADEIDDKLLYYNLMNVLNDKKGEIKMGAIKEVLEKIKELGWGIYEGDTYYELSQYSPAGQDFSVMIEKTYDIDLFLYNIRKAYEDYDVSYEASLWIGEDGHGKCGAPYELEDILNDIKWCKKAIYGLWYELSGEIYLDNSKEEIDYKEKANRYLTIAYNAICLGQLDKQYDKEELLKELGCTEEEYGEIMEV